MSRSLGLRLPTEVEVRSCPSLRVVLCSLLRWDCTQALAALMYFARAVVSEVFQGGVADGRAGGVAAL